MKALRVLYGCVSAVSILLYAFMGVQLWAPIGDDPLRVALIAGAHVLGLIFLAFDTL